MSVPTTYGTTTVRLVHVVRMRHTTTGEPIPATARLDTVPYGWSLRVRGAEAVVTARDGVPTPTTKPTLTITAADPRTAALLATPSVDVPLTSADITVDVAPAPLRLVLELLAPSTGAPRTGRTVVARATGGPNPKPTVPLPEVDPGVYRSAPVTWTSDFVPLDLLVDGDLLRQLTVDVAMAETRVRLVDTT